MRHLTWLIMVCLLLSCKGNEGESAPFIINDDAVLEDYADKALGEAEQKVDSLFNTPLLDTSYFNSIQ